MLLFGRDLSRHFRLTVLKRRGHIFILLLDIIIYRYQKRSAQYA